MQETAATPSVPSRLSTSTMLCAACNDRVGESPWYVLEATSMLGPLCRSCAAMHFPERVLSE
jgi:hypothetical protein